MILYFSGTGNSLAISRQLAEKTGDKVMPLGSETDLSNERRIGLVFPCYWFNAPRVVKELVPKLKIAKGTYVYIVIPCGAQAGNSIWTVRKLLSMKGIPLAYSNKIRVPDNSAVGFGRNPNDQTWKFSRFADRLNHIADDIAHERQNLNYAWWGPIGALCASKGIQHSTLPLLTPKVNADKCVGCSICTKVCPMHNIAMSDGKAHCGNNCTQCLACVHFCPQQAVELNKKPTPSAHQYHHPLVTAKDLQR